MRELSHIRVCFYIKLTRFDGWASQRESIKIADDRRRVLEIMILRLFWPEGVRGDNNKSTEGEEEGDNFGQENGSTEASCLVNMILCYMN